MHAHFLYSGIFSHKNCEFRDRDPAILYRDVIDYLLQGDFNIADLTDRNIDFNTSGINTIKTMITNNKINPYNNSMIM